MRCFKKILKKIIDPGIIPTILIVIASSIFLIYTFASNQKDTLIAYLSYGLSTYALVIVCCKIPGLIGKGKRFIYENSYSGRYLSDIPYRIRVSLYWSLIVNSAYVSIKVISGLIYRSVWFGAIALYYVILCLIRLYLLFQIKGQELGKNKYTEYKCYRFCGILLLALNLVLSGVVFQMVRLGQGSRFPGMLIYAAALYTFYAIISAAANLIRYRKYDSPLISATKAINFTTAAVSILFLQTAMLAEFGGSIQFQKFINGATGCVVCVTILMTAFYMIAKGTKSIRNFHKEKHNDV